MKLTQSDKQVLKDIMVNCPRDLDQIQAAIDVMKYTCEDDEGKKKRIGIKEVLANLDRHTWLSCCDRAAFHWDATTEGANGKMIYFDASALFR